MPSLPPTTSRPPTIPFLFSLCRPPDLPASPLLGGGRRPPVCPSSLPSSAAGTLLLPLLLLSFPSAHSRSHPSPPATAPVPASPSPTAAPLSPRGLPCSLPQPDTGPPSGSLCRGRMASSRREEQGPWEEGGCRELRRTSPACGDDPPRPGAMEVAAARICDDELRPRILRQVARVPAAEDGVRGGGWARVPVAAGGVRPLGLRRVYLVAAVVDSDIPDPAAGRRRPPPWRLPCPLLGSLCRRWVPAPSSTGLLAAAYGAWARLWEEQGLPREADGSRRRQRQWLSRSPFSPFSRCRALSRGRPLPPPAREVDLGL
ncbi:hypothetical protein PVAP13_7NG005857 [Panicum virgatum]|uniref:Uncharacterized protein n=1 Tax=Panicum virgatum TaxID=38727 RepID=A0A8T0PX43_PANVG|nr:hypothetical protein PVAP13_7NG005857 [Panicum virgatum]